MNYIGVNILELSKNAKAIAEKRYFEENEDWEQLSRRVGKAASKNENDQLKWQDIFAEEIYNMNFIPGGRVLRNAGKIRQSMLNCACLPVEDSIESIGELIKNSLILWSYGAGLGVDFSPLREKGRPLRSKGGESSGMVSFLEAIDSVAHTIETGGQRRSGCLGMCMASHPEIFDFIDAKIEDKKLSYFNLSVAIDRQFIEAVENDDKWDLRFSGQTVRTVKAMDLWNKILDSQIKSGEPGIINYDNLRKNNSYYFQPISCVNLCSELPLPAYGMCVLGSLVLPSFISLSGKSTNWQKLEKSISSSIRFLDNMIDVNFFPLKQSEQVAKDSRRIGMGVMGLHDYFIHKRIKYGSEESINEIDRLFKFIRNVAYQTSIELAIEKGAFPKFMPNEYTKSSYVRKLPPKLRMDIKDKGIRNVTMLAAAPTGTTSLIADVSSGIEPIFSMAYKRKDRVSERIYIHKKLLDHLKEDKFKPGWMVDAYDLDPTDHLEVQASIQKFLDNSVSKTINCPKEMTSNKLSKILLEYIRDLVGITIYVDGSRGNQPLEQLNFNEIKKYLKDEDITSDKIEEDVMCSSGECDL